MKDPARLKTIFSSRFEEALKQHGATQKELAEKIGCSESLITNWKNKERLPSVEFLVRMAVFFSRTTDWLLGLDATPFNKEEHHGVRWAENLSHITHLQHRQAIEDGIELFKLLFQHGFNIDEVARMERFQTYTMQGLYATFKAAVRSGALVLTHVSTNDEIEINLKNYFISNYGINLKEVVVASISTKAISIIRAELVAFLAATKALTSFNHPPRAIGIGSGYTLARMAEFSIPTTSDFSGTFWIPLTSFPAENLVTQAANYIALVMSNRHMNSKALFLPFLSNHAKQPEDFSAICEIADSAFITVGAFNLHANTSDGREYRLLRVARKIEEAGLGESVAGEILGLYVDDNASPVGDETIQSMNKNEVYQIEFNVLRQTMNRGRVWLIASEVGKARAVRTAILNGLVNCLVIDREIAMYLLNS